MLIKTNGRLFTTQLMNGHVDVAKVFIHKGRIVNAVAFCDGRHFTSQQKKKDILTLRKC